MKRIEARAAGSIAPVCEGPVGTGRVAVWHSALAMPLCILAVGAPIHAADVTTIPDITITMGSASGGTSVFGAGGHGARRFDRRLGHRPER